MCTLLACQAGSGTGLSQWPAPPMVSLPEATPVPTLGLNHDPPLFFPTFYWFNNHLENARGMNVHQDIHKPKIVTSVQIKT